MSILIKPAYDADASAYFTTAGVTNTAGRQQISRFVTGIKDLGLYNNMVCWPLRSSQNAGTSTTAYSLGGLGTFNGTLVNGPTWGTDGVAFPTTAATHINATRPIGTAAADAYSIMSVHVGLIEDAEYRAVWIGRDASNDRMFFRTTTDAFAASNVGTLAPSANGNHTTVLSAGAGDTGKAVASYIDGTLSASTTGNATGTNTLYRIGGDGTTSGRSFGFSISFNAAFNLQLSLPQVASLHTLYKTTLGQGLGLP